MKHLMKAFVPAAALLCVAVSEVEGQACFGQPTSDGQFALALGAGLGEGFNTYGAGFNANVAGPLSFEFGLGLTDFEGTATNGNNFNAGLAYDLPVSGASVCPFSGLSYMRMSEEFTDGTISGRVTASTMVVPIGLGIGKRLPAGPNLFVDVFAGPQFMWMRGEIKVEGGSGFDLGFDGTETDFGITLGANLGTPAFFFGAGVGITTVEDADPTFTLRGGLVMGRR